MAVHYDVPFIPNPNDRCLVCCVGMVLGYFTPDKTYTMKDLDELCGYWDGHGTWPMEHLLRMADMGFEFELISDFDPHKFIDNPEGYMRELSKNPDGLEYQLKHTDLPKEQARYVEYMRRKLPWEKRKGTMDDVRRFLDYGWLVRLGINMNLFNDVPGYVGHSVLVIGYDDDGPILHNPDNGNNRPNQHTSWNKLEKAWQDFGDQSSVFAYRLKNK